MKILSNNMYLLLIDEEAEIKENDYLLLNNEHPKGRIRKCFHLTNNNALWNGKDWNTLKGKHFFIDPKESEGWGFVTEFECKKIIAYYPLTKEVKELDLPLLPNPYEEANNVEKLALEHIKVVYTNNSISIDDILLDYTKRNIFKSFISGYKAAFKQFSLKDMQKACKFNPYHMEYGNVVASKSDKEINEFIQSLSTQQLPKEFVPEIIIINQDYRFNEGQREELKTITNSEGKKELIGIYKY